MQELTVCTKPLSKQHNKVFDDIIVSQTKSSLCSFYIQFKLVLGKVGITLNIDWFLSKDDQIVNQDAAERALQFMGGWFANPIFGSGDYPSIMKLKVN
jgi:hypothetical protein